MNGLAFLAVALCCVAAVFDQKLTCGMPSVQFLRGLSFSNGAYSIINHYPNPTFSAVCNEGISVQRDWNKAI
jgi:hypothetical protein